MTWLGSMVIAATLLEYAERWRRGSKYREAIKYCKERRERGNPDNIVERLVDHSSQFYEPTPMHYVALLIGMMFLL